MTSHCCSGPRRAGWRPSQRRPTNSFHASRASARSPDNNAQAAACPSAVPRGRYCVRRDPLRRRQPGVLTQEPAESCAARLPATRQMSPRPARPGRARSVEALAEHACGHCGALPRPRWRAAARRNVSHTSLVAISAVRIVFCVAGARGIGRTGRYRQAAREPEIGDRARARSRGSLSRSLQRSGRVKVRVLAARARRQRIAVALGALVKLSARVGAETSSPRRPPAWPGVSALRPAAPGPARAAPRAKSVLEVDVAEHAIRVA